MFGQSKSIKSEEEIRTVKMQIDIYLSRYLRNFLEGVEVSGGEYAAMVRCLLLICEREVHYEETKDNLREFLVKHKPVLMPSYFQDMLCRRVVDSVPCAAKLNEVNILEKILTLTNCDI